MVAPSLAWTAAAKADMFEFMYKKVWYKFEDKSTIFDAYVTFAAATGDSSGVAHGVKFSGRTLTVLVRNSFITGWPTDPAYVTKWSGGCLRDESSGVGGFCLLETSSTDLTTAPSAPAIYGISGVTSALDSNTSRSMQIYRLSAANFATFEGAWASQAVVDSLVGQDGRCFRNSIASQYVSSGTEYFEVPYCTLSGNEHTC